MNIIGTEKQVAWAKDIIASKNFDSVSECERKEIFVNSEIKAAYIIGQKDNKASAIINNWFNPLLDNAINISELFDIEEDSEEYFDKEDELFDLYLAIQS